MPARRSSWLRGPGRKGNTRDGPHIANHKFPGSTTRLRKVRKVRTLVERSKLAFFEAAALLADGFRNLQHI